jgi:lysophospholipase L1-like esterase
MLRGLILLILLSGCKYDGLYVYGDSLTSPQYSWANQINKHNDLGGPYLQIHAVPGMTLTRFVMPSWISWTYDMQAVLIFLGANDIGADIPLELFAKSAQVAHEQAVASRLPLICVRIPDLPHIPEYQRKVESYRIAMEPHCDYVIDVPLDLRDTPDGLHMGPEGHKHFAAALLAAIEETGESDNDT